MPIIGLTAHLPEESNARYLKDGMNEIITKPMTLNLLLQKIEQYIGNATMSSPTEHEVPSIQTAKLKFNQDAQNETLLDDTAGVAVVGSIELLHTLRSKFIYEELPRVYQTATQAFAEGNIDGLQRIAHQVKSSALYCGAPRLKLACEQLEHYIQAGLETRIGDCYNLFMNTLRATEAKLAHLS